MKSFFLLLYISFFFLPVFSQSKIPSNQAQVWADSIYTTLTIEERVAQLFIIDSVSEELLSSIKKGALPQPGFQIYAGIGRSSSKKNISPLSTFEISDIRNGFSRYNSTLGFPDENTLSLIDQDLYSEYKSVLYKYLNQSYGFLTSHKWATQFLETSNDNSPLYSPPISNVWLSTNNLSPQQLNVYRTPSQFLMLSSQKIQQTNSISAYHRMFGPFKNNFELRVSEPSIEEFIIPGNLFYSTDYKNELAFISNGFTNRWLPIEKLENACKAILAMKYESILHPFKEIEKIDSAQEEVIVRKIYENSLAIIQHKEKSLLPFTSLSFTIRFFHEESSDFDVFVNMAHNYCESTDSLEKESSELLLWLTNEKSNFSANIEEQIENLKVNNDVTKVIMVWAGNLKMLPFTELPEALDALVLSPSANDFSWEVLAQALFNGIKVTSKSNNPVLPFGISDNSIKMAKTRLKYGIPQEVGMSKDTLQMIDSIVENAMKEKATPGAQLLIARKGVVVYQKSYGYQTYDKEKAIDNKSLYDLASISKIASTLPTFMKLYDQSSWRLNDRLAEYIPEAEFTDKADIKIRELLLHESGLLSYIPFYQSTIDTARLDGYLFSRKKTSKYSIRVDKKLYMNNTVSYREDIFQPLSTNYFSIQVAQGLYLNKSYKDSMLLRILNSSLKKKEYLYSDLNFLLIEKIVNKITRLPLDTLVYNWFYKSIGANSLRYNPLRFFELEDVVPTEIDDYFRRQLIRGYVHDQGAAMMGGVAGHAGLFGNANDLAKIMQMYLNFGEYGGQRYLNSETVRLFTSRQNSENRRGLGFDKPETNPDKPGPTGKLVSPLSFGHTGFTGTIVWADPVFDLIYIFLSNRTFPSGYINKLGEMNVRTDIQDLIYKSIVY